MDRDDDPAGALSPVEIELIASHEARQRVAMKLLQLIVRQVLREQTAVEVTSSVDNSTA